MFPFSLCYALALFLYLFYLIDRLIKYLNTKYDDIKLLLNVFTQHDQPIQVVCLQETCIEDTSLLDLSLFQIHDYNLVTQDKYASVHGGLALYINKNWSYIVKPCENKVAILGGKCLLH